MKLLNIAIIQSCNYDCYYCTMKKWIYPVGHIFEDGTPANAITNETLLRWLDAYIEPEEWILKITGGEPGLYPEIATLIPALTERGYKGLIETNGSLPIPQSENFIRLAAWHINRDMPKYYDTMLIIKNKDDNWEEKIEYCKINNIPYIDVMLRGEETLYDVPDDVKKTKLNGLLMIYSSGVLQMCPCIPNYGNILNMDKPQVKSIPEDTPCETCPQTQIIGCFYES